MDVESKTSSPAMADEKAIYRSASTTTARAGSVADVDLDQLGYKPEMARNRSMLTLLFQCLAIAAIRRSKGVVH